MTTSHRNLRLAAIALCAWGAGVFAAETPSPSAKEAQKPEASKDAAKEKADAAKNAQKDSAKEKQEQAKKELESFAKDHEALVKQLGSATEAQKKAIFDKMKEREKEFQEKLNALHKQMRDEERKQRQSSGPRK